jgi:hypothetical protein
VKPARVPAQRRSLSELLVARAAVHARPDPRRKAGLGDLRAGFALAGRMGEFIVLWSIYSRREGRELNIADFCRLSGESRRTVHRWLAEYRELFPELGEHATPQRLVAQLPDGSPERVMETALDLAAAASA